MQGMNAPFPGGTIFFQAAMTALALFGIVTRGPAHAIGRDIGSDADLRGEIKTIPSTSFRHGGLARRASATERIALSGAFSSIRA